MVSHVWLFLTLNLINGLRASVYQMTVFPSCVCLEFSRKHKKCVACSQSKLTGHFTPAGTRPSGKPSTPSTHIHSHARRHTGDNDSSVSSWGHTFSSRCKSSSFPPLLAASAKGCPWLCRWGPGLCCPETPFMLPFLLSSLWGPHSLQHAFWFPCWLLTFLVSSSFKDKFSQLKK